MRVPVHRVCCSGAVGSVLVGFWGMHTSAMVQCLLQWSRRQSACCVLGHACLCDGAMSATLGTGGVRGVTSGGYVQVAGTGKVTIGNYTYLDGDLHVKLSLCADSIISALIDKKGKDVTVAFLCTPTDLHVIPNEARQDAINNGSVFRVKWLAEKILTILGAGLKPNVLKQAEDTTSGKKLSIVNGISVAQGPNYALAKRLQHWRAILAYRAGCTVSSSVAPSTATASVVSNITFKWAYGGMPFFKPYEIFQQETTNAVMAALLVHDVRNSDGAKNPANQQRYEITNPMELFKFESFHGGVWRSVSSTFEFPFLDVERQSCTVMNADLVEQSSVCFRV